MHKFVPSISDAFLKKLIIEIDDDTIRGIVLGGSHARGNPTPYSDIDLACFVAEKKAFSRRSVFLSTKK